ncbi:hypothetical protein LP419_03810 [Massilia sp. H-1]|nr:hypothetical protein LP419_03810 [Massilia sp. H-1]
MTSPVIGKLLWSEEFNGSSLDTSRWTATDGNGCQINLCGYGNQELEYYSPNNLSVVNVPFRIGHARWRSRRGVKPSAATPSRPARFQALKQGGREIRDGRGPAGHALARHRPVA